MLVVCFCLLGASSRGIRCNVKQLTAMQCIAQYCSAMSCKVCMDACLGGSAEVGSDPGVHAVCSLRYVALCVAHVLSGILVSM